MYKVKMTDRIRQKLKLILGDNFDENKYSVYETIANDSTPITGGSGLYKNAVMTPSFLSQMSAVANSGYVPMINLHDEYTQLPVGRVFDAELFDSDKGKDLHVLFYVMSDSSPDSLDQKLQSGIINSVSSGSYPTKLNCSNCGTELTATEESIQTLIWDGKCINGHSLNKDFHVVMSELKSWDELSFVVQGAVPRAKLLNVGGQKLSHKSDHLSFAASANVGKLRFNASVTPADNIITGKPDIKGDKMDKVELTQEAYKALVKSEGVAESLQTQLNTANTDKADLQTKLTAAETSVTTLTAEKAQLAKDKEDLAAEKAQWELDKTELNSQVTGLKTQLTTAGIPIGGAADPAAGGTPAIDPMDINLYKRA